MTESVYTLCRRLPLIREGVHEITQQIPVAPPLFEEEADTYEEPSYVEENWQPMVQEASNGADSSEENELQSCLEWSAENPVQEKKPGWSETEELQQGNGFIPSEGREQQQERENGWQENRKTA